MSDPITHLNAALEGRYRIEREIGEGGMATVYLADDLKHERNVALKVLKPELAAVMGAERFLGEIKTTANLQHPHILPLYDSGEADGFLYYVMPFIEGETLADRIDREKQLPVEEAVTIATDVAEALHAAHEQGVIHRDVKPANILMSSGRPLVADFGIALAVSAAGGGRLTETGLSMGTPYYMSPEQASADREPTPASDVYSLGCVLYEMLVGDPPHTGSSAQAVLAKILTEDAPDATKTRASIPINVDAAIRKSLQKLPADRFSSAHSLTKALGDTGFRYGEAATAHAGMEANRWNALTVGLAALTLALAGLAAWAFSRSEPPTTVARYSLALPADQAFRPTNRVRHLAVDPHGEWFLYRGGEGEGGTQLLLRRHDQLQAAPIEGTDGAGNPAVSPDGSQVAFTCCNFGRVRLMVASIEGGPPIELPGLHVTRGGVSWGSDGYLYYAARDSAGESAGIARVVVGGGTPEQVTTPKTDQGEAYHVGPHALPNGKGLLFEIVRTDGTRDIAAVDLETGAHRIVATGAIGPRHSETGHLLYVSASGTLIAAPFDQNDLTVTGQVVPVFDGVWVSGTDSRTDVALGADGTLMYMSGDGGTILRELVWVTRDGITTEIDPALPAANYRDPALSPDGRQLAVTVSEGGEYEVWVKQLPAGRFSQFTLEGGEDPAWTADGQRLAFWSMRGGGGHQVYQRRSDGSAAAVLMSEPDAQPARGQVTFSRDGQWMVFTTGQLSSAGDIHAVRLDPDGAPAEDPIGLLTSDGDERHPALSPDGRWLAYSSTEAGGRGLYVCAFPACEVPYPISDEGTVPGWSYDGSELTFREGTLLRSVEIRADSTFDWGETRTLFSLAGFDGSWPHPRDVTRDNERFVMIRDAAGGEQTAELIVIRNFSDILEERVPN